MRVSNHCFILIMFAVFILGACSGPRRAAYSNRVDVLFVIDNSGSMGGHQTNLANNITAFTNHFLENGVDFQIGVISTDGGDLVGATKIVTTQTPDAATVLASNLQVGTSGSAIEKPLDSVLDALSYTKLNGVNSRFIRRDAKLVVVFVTDADDQSTATVDEAYDFVVNVKSYSKHVYFVGVVVPSSVAAPTCTRDGPAPTKIEELLAKTPWTVSNVLDLCGDFGVTLSDIAIQISTMVRVRVMGG